MRHFYETAEETQTRLYNSVVMYKGEPAYCSEVHHPDTDKLPPSISLMFLPRMVETAKIRLDDPDLNIKLFDLGYVNTPKGATYAYRMPVTEGYKQGLWAPNLKFTPYFGTEAPGHPDFGGIMRTPGFRDMLQGTYPSLKEVIERLKGDQLVSAAFTSALALRRDKFRGDFLLEYRGEKVGFGVDAFQLPEEYKYLQETLKKNGVTLR